MIEKMENNIGQRPNKSVYPIWAWYQSKNNKVKRPNLRSTGFLPKGTKGVRIEFDKPENQILLSDFALWHFPLNYWHIADNEKEDLEFHKLLKEYKVNFIDKEKYPFELRKVVENSWNKILDMHYHSGYVADKFIDKKIQATLWCIKSSEITKVDFFNAK
jgi:hypothetical protein